MNKKHLIQLASHLLSINNQKEMRDFLSALLTEKELSEIPVRLQIVKMLKQKHPQRKISQKLGVGVATVTRGSKELQKGHFQNV